jgi:phosphoribosylformylglycinamidine synthase
MAIAAVDEALRNVICAGANPNATAILDNFCWPKVDTEESLGALVRACRGAMDAAIAYGLPFISGKDSLNNEFSMSADEAARVGLPTRLPIPYTLLISALGIVDDIRRCVTMDLKEAGNRLVLASAPVGRVGLGEAKAMHDKVAGLITGGKVRSAHDVSDGGLAGAIAEMCIAADLGATVTIAAEVDLDSVFTPLATTYVLEMSNADAKESGLPIIGRVEGESGQSPRLRIHRGDANLTRPVENRSPIVDLPIARLADAWKRPLAQGGAL